MPKIVDHDQRRKQIAEAVWAIVAFRGFEAVTLRSVAAEAGVSMGTVQHYFTNKEEMIYFACTQFVEQATSGADSLREQSNEPNAPRTIIRAIMQQTMPLTDEQRIGSAVWLAFVSRAAVDDQLGEFIREAWNGLHRFVGAQLRAAQEAGQVPTTLDTALEAASLIALADGLASHLLVGQYSPAMGIEAVDHRLEQLFTDPAGPQVHDQKGGPAGSTDTGEPA